DRDRVPPRARGADRLRGRGPRVWRSGRLVARRRVRGAAAREGQVRSRRRREVRRLVDQVLRGGKDAELPLQGGELQPLRIRREGCALRLVDQERPSSTSVSIPKAASASVKSPRRGVVRTAISSPSSRRKDSVVRAPRSGDVTSTAAIRANGTRRR